jgi:hypothetical protein
LIQGAGQPGALAGPAIIPRPIVLALLLGLPAVLAVIAAIRDSRPIFVAAGVLCLLQSFIAFSGITLGFVLPGCVLIGLGLSRSRTMAAARLRRREALAGFLVVGLGIAAWLVPFATSETVCWTARLGPDGEPVYTLIPDTGIVTLQVDEIASGCDGGAFTLQGLMMAGVLTISAAAMAELAGTGQKGGT